MGAVEEEVVGACIGSSANLEGVPCEVKPGQVRDQFDGADAGHAGVNSPLRQHACILQSASSRVIPVQRRVYWIWVLEEVEGPVLLAWTLTFEGGHA